MGIQTSKPKSSAAKNGKRLSKTSEKILIATNGSNAVEDQHNLEDDPNCPKITEENRKHLKTTWNLVKSDINKVGVVTFMGLFETHPDTRDVFVPFKNIPLDDVRYSDTLREHALRVMTTVDKVMTRIDDMPKVFELLSDLGRRHASYNAKPEYIDLIGPQFLFAIQPALGEHWTSEAEDAWCVLIRLMTYIIRTNMTL